MRYFTALSSSEVLNIWSAFYILSVLKFKPVALSCRIASVISDGHWTRK